jgi:hypothetical protein
MSGQSNLWDACRRLLLVFPFCDHGRYDEYKKAFDRLLNQSNVQEVQVLVFFSDVEEAKQVKKHPLIHFFSKKSFTLFGKLKDSELINVIIQPYDVVFICELTDKKVLKLLRDVHAPHKIAVNTSVSFCSIRAQSNTDNPWEIVNFGKHTLSKINYT